MVIILVRIIFYEWTLEMKFIGNNFEILLSGFAKRHTEQTLFNRGVRCLDQTFRTANRKIFKNWRTAQTVWTPSSPNTKNFETFRTGRTVRSANTYCSDIGGPWSLTFRCHQLFNVISNIVTLLVYLFDLSSKINDLILQYWDIFTR